MKFNFNKFMPNRDKNFYQIISSEMKIIKVKFNQKVTQASFKSINNSLVKELGYQSKTKI